jgi:hypothetical protein
MIHKMETCYSFINFPNVKIKTFKYSNDYKVTEDYLVALMAKYLWGYGEIRRFNLTTHKRVILSRIPVVIEPRIVLRSPSLGWFPQ